MKVVGIAPPSSNENIMYGVAPHGIVPYSLGLMAFGSLSKFLHNPAIGKSKIIGLFLYTVGILCNVELCIRQL